MDELIIEKDKGEWPSIIQLRQLGDVLMTTPLVRQIKKIYPNCELHFLVEKLGSQVYQHNLNVDKIVVIANKMNLWDLAKTYRKISQEKYDMVIDCFCNPKSAQVTFFSMAKQRIGFKFKGRKYAYNNKDIENNFLTDYERINEYSAIAKLRLIEHLGCDLKDNTIEFPLSQELKEYAQSFFKKYFNEKKVVALNVVSRRDYKVFSSESYVKVADWLIENGYFILFTYGPSEYDLAKNVFDSLQDRNKALINHPMQTIPQLRALLEHCVFYLGNDGGIKHLAVCAQIPTFTIFQGINWVNWTPPHNKKHFALTNCLKDNSFCEKCVEKNTCFADLSYQKIILLLKNFIADNI